MTQRDIIRKWLIYALGLVPVWVLDAGVLPRYPVLGVSPMLLPSAAVAVAVLEGARAGTGYGLGVGLLWELTYPGSFGGLAAGTALAGLLTGAVTQLALRQTLSGCLLCTGAALAVLDGLRVLWGLLTQTAPLQELLRVAVPEVVLSLIWALPVWFWFRALSRRVGGPGRF